MHPGGISDKTGNRFEARWLTWQLLDLLDASAHSITVEKIGDGEEGFEFVVERADWAEWHQCKRQTSEVSWTITALDRESILGNFLAKLRLSAAQRCIFVSTDIVKQLKLLQEKLEVSPSLKEFEDGLSDKETEYWQALQARLGAAKPEVMDWLDRCEFKTFSEDVLEEMVASKAAYWFTGDPDKIVSSIRAWVEEDSVLNRPIDRATFLAFAAKKKFELKQYEADQTLPGRLESATQGYSETYPAVGSHQFEIERPEVAQLVDAVLGDGTIKIVALVGPAGAGKSVIVRQAVERIGALGHTQLAFRVDQIGEPLSLSQLGTAVIDVADSPAVVLEKLSGNRPSILYIDQADAVSQMSGRAAQVRRQLVDLVNQAQRYPHLRLVFSCRTFDIDNDQAFSEIARRDCTLRIDIPPFDWDRDVAPVLQKLAITIDPDNVRVRALLSQPIGLALAAQLARNGVTDLRNVDSLSQLFDTLVADRERDIRERHKPAWALYPVLEAIAQDMSRRQELVAPARLLDRFAGAREILQQENLIVVAGQRISLIHESLFDFLHARAFASGDMQLIDFLMAGEQTLFRRTQVRQILAAERDLEPKRYRSDLEAVLLSGKVRRHVRDLVLRWLGTVAQPTAEEWNIIARYSAKAGDGDFPGSLGIVLFDQQAWFELLAESGILLEWLRGSNASQRWALSFCRSISGGADASVATAVNRYLDEHPEKSDLVVERLHWLSPKQASPLIADTLIRALGMIDDPEALTQHDEPFGLHGSWIEHAPVDGARILAASFASWYRLHRIGAPFKPGLENGSGGFHHLVELAKAVPFETLQAILPAMRIGMLRMPGPPHNPQQDQIWNWRRYEVGDHASVEFLDVVRDALARVAVEAPGDIGPLLAILDPATQITGLHLLLETVAANGGALAPLLAEQRSHPELFASGFEGAPAYSAAKAIAAAWDHLDVESRETIEQRTLNLWPELDDAKWALSLSDPAKNQFNRTPADIRGMARHYLALSGLRQWSVLRLIGDDRLSQVGRGRLQTFERKFAGMNAEEPSVVRVRMAQSPIASDRAANMSDESWIRAIERIGERRQENLFEFRGGANELAHVLQARVKEEPDRFIALMQRFPKEAGSTAFANAVVMGVSENSASPARTEGLFELIEKDLIPRPDDRNLIWLIRATNGPKGPLTLNFMLQLATAGEIDSGVGERAEGKPDKPEPAFKVAVGLGNYLDSRAMNSPRAAALQEIGQISWADVEQFKIYSGVVDPLFGSDMPDYMHASLGAMLRAALKHDLGLASDWITRTARVCPTALFTRNGRGALYWLDSLAHDAAKPILEAFIESPDTNSNAVASLLVAQRSLDDEVWKPTIDTLIEVGPVQRAAIAEIATAYVSDAAHLGRATSWLIRLFDDEDEGVRSTAVDCFRRIDPAHMATYAPLYEAYVGSKHFNAERTYFLHKLESAPAVMDDLVLDLIEKTVRIAKGRVNGDNHGLYQLWEPLLRIYASCGDNAERLSRCLDVVDDLILLNAIGSNKLNALT